ncbi:MAG: CheB methylesterase domain-containing protein [Planctomycetota bacterium]
MKKVVVVALDESAVARERIRTVLENSPDVELAGVVSNAGLLVERSQLSGANLFVISCSDPIMEDWATLDQLRRAQGAAILLTCRDTNAIEPLRIRGRGYGVLDAVPTPLDPGSTERFLQALQRALPHARRAGSHASHERTVDGRFPPAPPVAGRSHRPALIAIGASTGGIEATATILREFPADAPPTLLVQHIRGHFADAHARGLDEICPCEVTVARHGAELRSGTVLVAPGDRHMVLTRIGGRLAVHLDSSPAVNYHRPSVDRLFDSIARSAVRSATGVLLTGMGCDGAAGLLRMREAGMRTLAQDKSSSTVYGMPKVAVDMGGVQHSLPLDQIAGRLFESADMDQEIRERA